jgi:hypothetical protein
VPQSVSLWLERLIRFVADLPSAPHKRVSQSGKLGPEVLELLWFLFWGNGGFMLRRDGGLIAR